jgi:hypothetical protein
MYSINFAHKILNASHKHHIYRWLLASLPVLLIVIATAYAYASIILAISDQQMTVRASSIVRGKVVKQFSQLEQSDRRIYTYTTISVLDMLKGPANTKEITIRQLGGIANGIGMHVPGSASFSLGEEVFVFLESNRISSHYLVMGMAYGKYSIITDPKTQIQYLRRDLHGISLASPTPTQQMQIQHPDTKTLLVQPLNTFLHRIRGYLQAQNPPQIQKHTIQPKLTPPAPNISRPQTAEPIQAAKPNRPTTPNHKPQTTKTN